MSADTLIQSITEKQLRRVASDLRDTEFGAEFHYYTLRIDAEREEFYLTAKNDFTYKREPFKRGDRVIFDKHGNVTGRVSGF